MLRDMLFLAALFWTVYRCGKIIDGFLTSGMEWIFEKLLPARDEE